MIGFQFVCMQNFWVQYGNDSEGHIEHAYFRTKIVFYFFSVLYISFIILYIFLFLQIKLKWTVGLRTVSWKTIALCKKSKCSTVVEKH